MILERIQWAWLLENCLHSVLRVFVGVLIAAIAGVLLGLGRSQLPEFIKGNPIFKLLVDGPKFIPPIAWIPAVIILFGIGEISAYAIVFIGAFSPIFINAFDGAESLPKILKNTANSLEIKNFQFFFKILLPYSLPQIFTGIRAGISMGWMAVIASEMVSGQSGLGYSIQLNRLNLQYDLMAVDMICIGIIGYLLFSLVIFLERFIVPWSEEK